MIARTVTLTTVLFTLATTGCQIGRIVYRPAEQPLQFHDELDVILAADFIQDPPPAQADTPEDAEKADDADEPQPSETPAEDVTKPLYTVPGPQYRQFAILAFGIAAFGINDATGAGKEASESQVLGSSISVVGRPGLSAPPPRVNGAIVGRPGLQNGFAAGLGRASDRNIFTPRLNALSGLNGRCQDLANAGFFGGSRATCETHFGR